MISDIKQIMMYYFPIFSSLSFIENIEREEIIINVSVHNTWIICDLHFTARFNLWFR